MGVREFDVEDFQSLGTCYFD